MSLNLSDREIAHVCHEANRALQKILGDRVPSPEWAYAPNDQRESATAGVTFARHGATPEQQHEAWCATKREQGWRHGAIKDAIAKTHPCLVPYDELPAGDKVKDALFLAVVDALAAA